MDEEEYVFNMDDIFNRSNTSHELDDWLPEDEYYAGMDE